MNKIFNCLLLVLCVFTLASCVKDGEYVEVPGDEIQNIHPLPERKDDDVVLGISKDSVKILAIGNSFSDNAMNQMYSILKAFGANEIVLGNMYIGGCTIDTHYNNAVSDSESYTYRKNDSRTTSAGTFVNTANTKISTALADEEWQVVTFQQGSHDSGVVSTYDEEQLNYLTTLASSSVDNEDLRIGWHMTWAYQGNSTHSAFPKYDSNQLTMYEAICACVQSNIETNDNFDFVIPAGTAVQNARTSYIGDTLTADGYHLNSLGEYIIGVTWVLKYTGWSIDDLNVDLVPNEFKKHIDVIKESALNALEKPYEITKSKITEQPKEEVDYSNYDLLKFDAAIGYWNSTDSKRSTIQITDQSIYMGNTVRFTKEDIPVGSIIVVADGWQYRPDGWTTETGNTAGRPGETKESVINVDEAWWGSFIYRAFNISKVGKPKLTADDVAKIDEVFKIYVPKSDEYSDYDLLSFESAIGYWNSTDSKRSTILITDQSKYIGNTVRFTKEDIPVGSIIVVAEGWQYRPDGWTTENGNTAGRPAETKESVINVDEAWWGSFIYRAFNISKVGKPNLTADDLANVGEVFKIYVPKKTDEFSNYDLLSFESAIGYWNSKDATKSTVMFTNQKKYLTNTILLSKEDIPVGSIIVVAEGWQYRPDGWTSETGNTGTRPGETAEERIVVDEAWWGSFIYRAFNISKIGKPDLTADDLAMLNEVFKIYVPKK